MRERLPECSLCCWSKSLNTCSSITNRSGNPPVQHYHSQRS
nr:MAG TPA: hypothetical protein [Bacteriophage sp.]